MKQSTLAHEGTLDGFRALSTIAITALHSVSITNAFLTHDAYHETFKNVFFRPFSNGIYIVEMLFVLSGYLIAKEWVGNTSASYSKYLKRRLIRILPLLFIVALIDAAFPVKGLDVGPSLSLWKNIFFVNNLYSIIPPEINQPIGKRMAWTWSIDVQMHSYIFMPIIIMILSVFKSTSLQILGALSLVPLAFAVREKIILHYNLHTIFPVDMYNPGGDSNFLTFYVNLYEPTWARFGSIAIGVVCFYLVRYYSDKVKKIMSYKLISYPSVLLSIGFIFMILYSPLITEPDTTPPPDALLMGLTCIGYFFAIATSILLVACLTYNESTSSYLVKLLHAVMSHKMWRIPSDLSYAVYLTHIIIFHFMYQHVVHLPSGEPFTPSNWFTSFIILSIPTWIISYLLTKAEKVLLSRPKKEKSN